MSMIIDIHTHCFPDAIAARALAKLSAASNTPPMTDGTAEGLSAAAREAGVDLSIVMPVATNPGQVQSINDFAARLNERTSSTGLFSFGGAHPDDPDWEAHLEQVAARGMKGVKVHPVYQGVRFDDPRFLRILTRAGELGLIVLTHAGYDIGFPGASYCSPETVCRAVRKAGPVTLVLAHMGGWQQWKQAEELLTDTGVFLDTSFALEGVRLLNGKGTMPFLNQEDFLRMVRAFGADRILFGSDSPWSSQRESLTWLRALPLTAPEQAAILGENARRLLRIASPSIPAHHQGSSS